jgi:hypothetical protein
MTFKEFLNDTKDKISGKNKKDGKKNFWNYSVQAKTALLLFCVGFGFSIIGLISGGFRAESAVMKDVYVIEDLADVKNLNLDLDYGDVQIFSTDGAMRVEAYNVNKSKLSENGSEKSRSVEYNNHFSLVSFSIGGLGNISFGDGYYLSFGGFYYEPSPTFKVYIPSATLDKLSVSNNLGTVKMLGDENFSLGNLEIEANLGEVELRNVKVDNLTDIKADLGETDLENFFTGTLEIENNLGGISYSGDIYRNADINSDLGSVELNLSRPVISNDSPYGFNVDVDLGEIEVESMKRYALNQFGEVSIDITCDLGSVSINGNRSKYNDYDDYDFDD